MEISKLEETINDRVNWFTNGSYGRAGNTYWYGRTVNSLMGADLDVNEASRELASEMQQRIKYDWGVTRHKLTPSLKRELGEYNIPHQDMSLAEALDSFYNEILGLALAYVNWEHRARVLCEEVLNDWEVAGKLVKIAEEIGLDEEEIKSLLELA